MIKTKRPFKSSTQDICLIPNEIMDRDSQQRSSNTRANSGLTQYKQAMIELAQQRINDLSHGAPQAGNPISASHQYMPVNRRLSPSSLEQINPNLPFGGVELEPQRRIAQEWNRRFDKIWEQWEMEGRHETDPNLPAEGVEQRPQRRNAWDLDRIFEEIKEQWGMKGRHETDSMEKIEEMIGETGEVIALYESRDKRGTGADTAAEENEEDECSGHWMGRKEAKGADPSPPVRTHSNERIAIFERRGEKLPRITDLPSPQGIYLELE